MILLLTLLIVKHFVFDFLYQPPYQFLNKGTYGHPGGIVHASQHFLGTAICLFLVGVAPHLVVLVSIFEGVIHYHVDWAKMRTNAHFGLKAQEHYMFWVLLGVDQLLHYLTYVGIIAWVL